MRNTTVVTGRSPSGEPTGVAPDMARAVADRLGVPIRYATYNRPFELADAVTSNAWDIGLIRAEPQRTEHIVFTDAYAEIEATYVVPDSSNVQHQEEVDAPGKRTAVAERTAYGLWLDRNIKQAEIVRSADMEIAIQQFVDQKLDALAGLRTRLARDVERLPGLRILDGRFTTIQQAIGTPIANTNAFEFLADFVEEAKEHGAGCRFYRETWCARPFRRAMEVDNRATLADHIGRNCRMIGAQLERNRGG